MNDLQREAIAVLEEVWAMSPGVRLGQLMAHLGFLGESHINKGLGYMEDDELVAILYRHREELRARLDDRGDAALQPTGDKTSLCGSSTLPEQESANSR